MDNQSTKHNLRTRTNNVSQKETTNKISKQKRAPVAINVSSKTSKAVNQVLPKRLSTGVSRLSVSTTVKTPVNPTLSNRSSTCAGVGHNSTGFVKTTSNNLLPKRPSTGPVLLKKTPSTAAASGTPQTESLSEKVIQLQNKSTDLEKLCNRLQSENEGLQITVAFLSELQVKYEETEANYKQLKEDHIQIQQTILNFQSLVADLSSRVEHTAQLKLEVGDLIDQLHHLKVAHSLVEKGVSTEQQDINSNIVIRGVDLIENQNDSEPELTVVYDKVRSHLGVSEISDFKAVSVKVLQPKNHLSENSKKTPTANTIQVRLSSALTKRQFLQIRRIKKDILSSDIGLSQNSKKPILITEQLTRENQELLFNARSLRKTNNYKFVWSNNGQILARPHPGSRVIRIKDIDHIKCLRTEIQPHLPTNGRIRTNSTIKPNSSNSQE